MRPSVSLHSCCWRRLRQPSRVQLFEVALGPSGPKYFAFDGDHIWLADEYNLASYR